jgi:predicted dehydrogenase/threonine dehydrogenase-like Zn-dependent dehydrogenase
MKMLAQRLKDGMMRLLEVPIPAVRAGHLLVSVHYSLISAGTEGGEVKAARKSLIVKAKDRPQQVQQVLDTLRIQGLMQTYRDVMKKLEAYSGLGYSCVGEVIEIGPGVVGFGVGDVVACAGNSASHAEYVSVPFKLGVRLRPGCDLKQAAYNTLGAIALQGVRQADVRLGESCAVIGLGLIGQLVCCLLRAAGVRTIGVDINQAMVKMAARHCADLAIGRDDAGIEDRITQFTDGLGCDAVIITAATASLDPINFAGVIARKRGTIVVLGAVPTGFEREPHYYRKELQLRMSCSYGPGRYDPDYEEKGRDYPPGYVRWTENRNMHAFQELIHKGVLNISFLTTHVFKLDESPKAFQMILDRSEPYAGILLEYDASSSIEATPRRILLQEARAGRGVWPIGIGFIGAGSYAQSHLLPNVRRLRGVILKGVVTSTSASSRSVGERFGFEYCTSSVDEILADRSIGTVFIASRHDSHAQYVMNALKMGKNVFVEKPLCLSYEELEEIRCLYEELSAEPDLRVPLLVVGYNRRFSPFIREAKKTLGVGPMAAVCRVNAGAMAADSWIQDLELGGGRIIGELCHFVDTLSFIIGSSPISVFAAAIPDPFHNQDTLQVCLKYCDGSTSTISYLANGAKSLAKERIEVFSHGITAVIDDFKTLSIYSKDQIQKKNLLSQNKGQADEVRIFLDAIRKGNTKVISFSELYNTSLVTFKVLESIERGANITLSSIASP